MLLVAASSQYATVPTFATGSSGMSFSLWFQSTSTTGVRLFEFGTVSPQESFGMGINSGYIRGFRCVAGSCLYPFTEAAYLPMSDNVWRHVVWTMNPSGVWIIYLNGLVFNSYSGAAVEYVSPGSHPNNYFGKTADNSLSYLNGAIDEFYMFKTVLTPSQVQTLYQKGTIQSFLVRLTCFSSNCKS